MSCVVVLRLLIPWTLCCFFFIINDGLAGLSVILFVLFCVATIYTLGAAFSGPASGHVWHGEASRRIHGEN